MPWTEQLDSGRYRAVWRDAAGKQRSRSGFVREAAAMRYAGQQESSARSGQVSYQGRSVTFGGWCDAWLRLRVVERTSRDSDLYRINRWLLPRWGDVQLARITAEDVQVWVIDLSREMAPASVERTYRLLSSSLRAAVRHKRLAVSPCVGVALPVVPPPDERFLTRGEVDLALHHMREPYRTAVIVLVGTGMRFGEMAGLHRQRIDWDAQAIDVIETWDGAAIKAYPKGRRKRRVPMPSWVADAIAQLPNDDARSCGHPHVTANGREMARRCGSGLWVTGPRGAPLDARNMLRRHWADALARAGLPHARQHDLRHTCASWLIQAGCSMAEIAEILGHAETTVTARYAHLAGTHMDRVRAAMEGQSVGTTSGGAPYLPHKAPDQDRGPDAVGQ